MKIHRFYRSLLVLPKTADRQALSSFKRRCWEEPAEGDNLRDTVLSRKRLDYVKYLIDTGKLTENNT